MRIESEHSIDMGGAGTGFRHSVDGQSVKLLASMTPEYRNWLERERQKCDVKEKRLASYPAAQIINARRATADQLIGWANELGVSTDSLIRLHAGISHDGTLFLAEEHECGIVGLQERNGRKINRGKRGLYIPDLSGMAGPLIFSEGASDVSAAITVGLPAIGLPGAGAGLKHLTATLLLDVVSSFSWDNRLIVVADNDGKSDGRKPGFDGAIKVANHLTNEISIRATVVFPPGGHKDLRAFLNAGRREGRSLDDLRRELLLQPAIHIAEPPAKTAVHSERMHGSDCDCKECSIDVADVAYLRHQGGRCEHSWKAVNTFRPAGPNRAGEYKSASFNRFRLRCKCMACSACRPLILADRLEQMHAMTRVDHGCEIGTRNKFIALYETTVKKWPALRKQLSLQKASYYRVRMTDSEDSSLIVFANRIVHGGVTLSPENARRRMTATVTDSTSNQRPVSAGRNWKFTKSPPESVILGFDSFYDAGVVEKTAKQFRRTAKFKNDPADLFTVKQINFGERDNFQAGVTVNLGSSNIEVARNFYEHIREFQNSTFVGNSETRQKTKVESQSHQLPPYPPRPPNF